MRLPALDLAPVLVLLALAGLLSGTAAPSDASPPVTNRSNGTPRFEAVLSQQADRLARVTDDAAALVLYRDSLARALEVSDTLPLLSASARRIRAAVPPPDIKAPALALVKALTRWETARRLRAAAEAPNLSALAEIPARERTRRAWLDEGSSSPALDRALRLAQIVAAMAGTEESRSPLSTEELERFASLDRRYPALASGAESWIEVAVRDGLAGVLRRLVVDDGPVDPTAPPATAVRYFQSRLHPVFLAQIVAEAILAESDAARRASAQWDQLATWRETWSTARGLARLCGTWQWVVHNHQNHQDHKMVVTFPPPEADRSGPAVPKRIVVLGDSVYLRWEFPGGFQEDSLLFSGRDRRLEGTFVNSQGPYGAITGRRVGPCEATP